MEKTHGKAIKKPIEINWFLWQGDIESLSKWHNSFENKYPEGDSIFIYDMSDKTLRVNTLEGSSYAVPEGYYILRGIEGEYYPCESKIFQKSYNIL